LATFLFSNKKKPENFSQKRGYGGEGAHCHVKIMPFSELYKQGRARNGLSWSGEKGRPFAAPAPGVKIAPEKIQTKKFK